MMLRRSCLARAVTAALFVLGLAAGPAVAASQNVADDGLAVHGYDVVAYFTMRRPVPGVVAYEARHHGATYRFVSMVHRTAFLANPERYVPRYGGFCAYDMRVGRRTDIDPKAWVIHAGRLFLMKSRGEEFSWRQDPPVNVRMADSAWQRLAVNAAGH